jgi:membrane-associated phospholipid phosphatase
VPRPTNAREAETELLAHLAPSSPAARSAARVASLTSRGGMLWFLTALALRTTRGRRGSQAAIDGVGAWIASETLSFALKQTIGRPRPALPGDGPAPRSTSMPSSHTASAFAFATAAGTRLPSAAAPLALLATTIAWSRISTQRHFPSDVLVGTLTGCTTGAAVAYTRRRRQRPTRHGPWSVANHCGASMTGRSVGPRPPF